MDPPLLLELGDRQVGVIPARRGRERTAFVVPADRARIDELEAGRRTKYGLRPAVDDDRVERPPELAARGLAAEVRGAAPHDLVLERLAPHDLVEEHANQVRGAPVEVDPQ